MRGLIQILTICIFVPSLLSCGGGGSSGEGQDQADIEVNNDESSGLRTGVFYDSAVHNLRYSTVTQSGVTNQNGEFNYQDGERIIFSIGDIELPETTAKAEITPLDLYGTTSFEDNSVVNLARLLQSIDVDNNPDNGISIDEIAHSSATGMSLNFSSPDFDIAATNLVANSGSSRSTLVSSTEAVNHLRSTFVNFSIGSLFEYTDNGTPYIPWGVSIDEHHRHEFEEGSFNGWFDHCEPGLSSWLSDECTKPLWGVVRIYSWEHKDYSYISRSPRHELTICRPTVDININGEEKQIIQTNGSVTSLPTTNVHWYPDPEDNSSYCQARGRVVDEMDGVDLELMYYDIEFHCTDAKALPPGSTINVHLNYADANDSCSAYLNELPHEFDVQFEGDFKIRNYPMGGLNKAYGGVMSVPNGNTWVFQGEMHSCAEDQYFSEYMPYCQILQ